MKVITLNTANGEVALKHPALEDSGPHLMTWRILKTPIVSSKTCEKGALIVTRLRYLGRKLLVCKIDFGRRESRIQSSSHTIEEAPLPRKIMSLRF